MKLNKLLLLLLLGLIAGAYGFSQYQSLSSDLVACCPVEDPECDDDDDDDDDDDSDSMPSQVLV
ncbi:hypothetical protein QEH59_17985 [Coraliomargarita sp. SDUM461004]|uniref:Uncharacterized protein n=1 Tax=Thalassobacterium sedimentorum TaxID=3041258 RepID=A0ABU1ANG6_9BACT|nr:hypothetical protein [Coraliomargarita sp. SDUM461004]MDQ8196331.1 hypothetical protein [Coraliomargarita sp. SDUM461004]